MNNNILVLLASYNGEKYIAQQIKTIFSQRNCNVSVLVSDDCSDDGYSHHGSSKNPAEDPSPQPPGVEVRGGGEVVEQNGIKIGS